MNLKGVFNNNYEKWKVYLLVEEGRELLGLYSGDLKGKGTSAEYQMVGPAENINKTSKSFQEVKGLVVISSGNKKYATFWKDSDITIEEFREYSDEKPQKTSNVIDFVLDKKNHEENLEAMNIEKENKLPTEKAIVQQEAQRKKEVPFEVKPNIQRENMKKPEMPKAEEPKEEVPAEVKKEIEEEPEINLNENWDKLIDQYKRISPFPERDVECLQIELKDLRILPKSQWVLSTNSFVLHGFYNYHYLILGKVKDRFIIGVPGIFCNKEKLVAGLFGFNDFKPAQVSEYKTGRFGYWYKYL